MPAILLTIYWLESQGYDVFENIVYQDNISVIVLKNIEKASRSNHTKHLETRYYYVIDHIENMKSY